MERKLKGRQFTELNWLRESMFSGECGCLYGGAYRVVPTCPFHRCDPNLATPMSFHRLRGPPGETSSWQSIHKPMGEMLISYCSDRDTNPFSSEIRTALAQCPNSTPAQTPWERHVKERGQRDQFLLRDLGFGSSGAELSSFRETGWGNHKGEAKGWTSRSADFNPGSLRDISKSSISCRS